MPTADPKQKGRAGCERPRLSSSAPDTGKALLTELALFAQVAKTSSTVPACGLASPTTSYL